MRLHAAADRYAGARGGAVAVDLDAEPDPGLVSGPLSGLDAGRSSLPFVVVGVHGGGASPDPLAGVEPGWLPLVDVVVGRSGPALAAVERTVLRTPQACSALAVLLRAAERRDVGEGLAAESAVYSTLQSGEEFAAWRASRPVRGTKAGFDRPRVRVERDGARLVITLIRPEVRNALDARMRDELSDALLVAVLDPAVGHVVLQGEGADFCAGGDLDEFGTRPDPATAHLVRLHRSPARLLAAVASRTTARLHGACIGSGIELPALAARVEVAPDVHIALPEVGMGLIPGAGGTWSLPARIGRHRTAWLALTGLPIDAPTAVAWGLADALVSGITER